MALSAQSHKFPYPAKNLNHGILSFARLHRIKTQEYGTLPLYKSLVFIKGGEKYLSFKKTLNYIIMIGFINCINSDLLNHCLLNKAELATLACHAEP